MRHAPLALTAAALLATLSLAAEPEKKEPEKKKWDVGAPPGEAATASLDTRTGTWMSVDASPDGKTLVFDLLGDLYTLPIEGGEAKPLTHGMAWDMQPRFSPDGKRIAYVSDAGGGDNVWVMNADGTGAHAVSSEDFRLLNNPVWHPSGDYVAARKHYSGTRSLGSGEIWLFHASGGKGVAAQREAELAEGPRRARVLARRPLRLLLAGRDSRARVRVQQELAPADLRDPAPRHHGRHDRAVRDRAGRRGAAGALARREAPRVRPPPEGADDAVREGPEDGRGAARVGRPRARPPGGVGDPRRLPRVRVAVRGLRDRRLGAGEDLARRHGVGRGEGRPLPREGHARGPQGRALRDGRRAGHVRRAPAPLGDRVPRRQPGRLLGARVPLRQGPPGRRAAAPHGPDRPLRALPERLARRPADRLHHLGRRRVRQRARPRREDGPRDGADEGARQVPRAALLAGRPHGRLHPRERRLPDLAVAGHRDGRLPRGGRRHGRAGARHQGRRRAAVRRVERAALRDAHERQERGRPLVDARLA